MKRYRIPIRIVLYPVVEKQWTARCLEFDISGDGDTKVDALKSLGAAIREQIEWAITSGSFINLFFPADVEFFEEFAAGRTFEPESLASVGLDLLSRDNVRIQSIMIREFNSRPKK